jgi:hypothetical protein
MKTIIIEKVKSFLTSVLIPGSTVKSRTPALVVYAPISDKNFAHMEHGAPGVVSAYFIHDIIALSDDPSDSRVNVHFHFSGESDEPYETNYVVTLGIHELAIVNVLGAMHDHSGGGSPIVFVDSNLHELNSDTVLDPAQISFALLPPHYKSEEAVEFSSKMSELFNASFSVPLSSRPWYENADEHEPSPILRAVQGRLLPILMGLSRGDVAYIKELIRFESELDNITSSVDEDDEDAVYGRDLLGMLVHTAKAVYGQAVLCNPSLQTVESNIENVGPVDYKPDVDVSFKEITSSPEFNDIFENVHKDFKVEKSENEIKRARNMAIWESRLDSNWPTNMVEIGKYLSELDDHEVYASLLSEDFNDVDRINERIQEVGLGKIFTALMLTISAYALKRVDILTKDNDEADFPAVLILNEWINVSEDNFVWEIPALAESLSRYETQTAVDVLTMYYQPRKNPSEAFHLLALLHTLGHHFADDPEWEDYDFSLLKSDLDSLEINTPKFKEFSEWFVSYIDILMELTIQDEESEEEDDDDDSCFSATAIRSVIESSEDIEKIAGFASLTLPVMADILAKKNPDLDEGGEEWTAFRQGYIHDVLTAAAESFGGRIKLVTR